MKKILLLFGVLAFFTITSCEKEELIDSQGFNKSKSIENICGDAKVVDLIAGQHINVGTVEVSNDENALYITYETKGNWSLTETHVYVGPENAIPLTGSGNPKIGHFPYSESHDNVQSYTYEIDLTTLDECFVIVTHAVVNKIENGNVVQGETAFGCGDKEFPGRRWGCYFDYCKQKCEEDCKPAYGKGTNENCFLDDGFEQWGWTNGPIAGGQRLSLFIDADDCDPSVGEFVGWVSIKYFEDERRVTARFWIPSSSSYLLKDTYLYVGSNKYPINNDGDDTITPEEFPLSHLDLGGVRTDTTYIIDNVDPDFFVIAHAIVTN